MAGLQRMCARAGCERLGVPTDARRCPTCGFVTAAYDEAAARRLLDPAVGAELPSRWRTGLPVSTADEIPGWEITDYVGEVFGVIVRSRGTFPQMGANLKSVVGGELTAMTNLLRATREEAIDRLVEEAVHRGADAVIAMRFDVTSMAETWTEVCAYGTAVTARRAGAAAES
jgi:uncharacterized protein YbjQ (UPF0145 family)